MMQSPYRISEGPPRLNLADFRHRRCFDWGSTSPVAPVGRLAREACLRRLDTAEDLPLQTRTETEQLGVLRQLLRELVNAPASSHVILGRSVTEFMSLLVYGLPRQPGRQRVVVTALDHPGFVMPWFRLAATGALELVVVEDRGDGVLDLDDLSAAVDERTWIVASTHVSHLYGTVQPVTELAAVARAAGAWSIVDGAQAVGRIRVDASRIGCDAYIGVGRKALLAPLGTAFMAVTASMATVLAPTLLSTRSAHLTAEGQVRTAPLPIALEGNLPDLAALQALAGCVQTLLQLPSAIVSRHALPLLELLATELAPLDLVPVRPLSKENAGLVSFHRRHPEPLPNDLQATLRIAGGFVFAADTSTLRLSAHISNEQQDAEDLAVALRRVL